MDKNVFRMISYGLYIVCAASDGRNNGQVTNTLFQLTSDPPRFGVSINKENLTHSFIHKSRALAFSILPQETPLSFIGLFGFKSGREVNKFEGVKYKTGTAGSPILLENSLGYIDAKVISEADVGTHTLFVCETVEAEVLRQGEPMTYAYYHKIKNGSAPPTAPTYIPSFDKKPSDNISVSDETRYVCSVCGYVYDPLMGDPENGIAPGTPFSQLPDNWACPVCGAAKSEFVPEK